MTLTRPSLTLCALLALSTLSSGAAQAQSFDQQRNAFAAAKTEEADLLRRLEALRGRIGALDADLRRRAAAERISCGAGWTNCSPLIPQPRDLNCPTIDRHGRVMLCP